MAVVLKTTRALTRPRGFESHTLRTEVFTFSRVHVHVWAWRCRPGPGQIRPGVSAGTSGASAYEVSGVGLAALNLWTGPKQGHIRAGQSYVKTWRHHTL